MYSLKRCFPGGDRQDRKRTPSNRNSPNSVPTHKLPSGVCARAKTLPVNWLCCPVQAVCAYSVMLCVGSRALNGPLNNSTTATACIAPRWAVRTEPPFTLTVDSLSLKTIGKLHRSQSVEFAATHHSPGPELNRQPAKRY